MITVLNEQARTLQGQVGADFGRHPDAEIYLSQPGLGPVLGARVLGEFGDDPDRYASGKARKNYAGTSPITRASGKRKVVAARFIRNNRLTDVLMAQALSQRAHCVIEPAAISHAEVLRHRDRMASTLARRHNSAMAKFANRRYLDLDHRLLTQEVVHEQKLPFIEHLVQAGAQLLCGCEVVPERLLHRHVRIPEQADGIQPVHDRREQRRRRLQVVQRPPGPRQLYLECLVQLRAGHVAGQIGQPPGQPGEHRVVDRLAGVLDRPAGPLGQLLRAHRAGRYAHHRTGQRAAPLQPVQRRKSHLPRQVPGDPEDHQCVRDPPRHGHRQAAVISTLPGRLTTWSDRPGRRVWRCSRPVCPQCFTSPETRIS